jgi:tight adherence protein B
MALNLSVLLAPRLAVAKRQRARARVAQLRTGQAPSRAPWPLPPHITGGGAVGVVIALLWLDPVLVCILAVGAAAGVGVWRRRATALVERRRSAQLPEALERMAAALRTGSSLPQALADSARGTDAPLGDELAGLAQQAGRGRPVLVVLDGWTERRPDRGTRLAAVALALATGVGAAPARALDGVAATLRERFELAAERHALAAQARASAVVLSLAPLAFAALLTLSDPAASRFLLATPAGWLCVAVGVGLDAAGAVWMARLTRGGET